MSGELREGFERFIPACAGNSSASMAGMVPWTVHPRVCGELSAGRPYCAAQPRFIPACAGNSPPSARSRRPTAVHPRVCGELAYPGNPNPAGNGSSPRVRGTLGCGEAGGTYYRFIPACAGNSVFIRPLNAVHAVHPRVCGELQRTVIAQGQASGSSPRVRGTRFAPRGRENDGRFIPACAGNSVGRLRRKRVHQVHPRVCGELLRRSGPSFAHSGSSPRVRGTPPGFGFQLGGHRFIPACAGNSRLMMH